MDQLIHLSCKLKAICLWLLFLPLQPIPTTHHGQPDAADEGIGSRFGDGGDGEVVENQTILVGCACDGYSIKRRRIADSEVEGGIKLPASKGERRP